MLKEFKEFVLRGNILELAVAFVIGLAFAAVVSSFVNDLIMPVVAMVVGEPDFSGLTFTINEAVFRFGAFITSVIEFVVIAAAVYFLVVRPVQAMTASATTPVEEGLPDEERRHEELLAALNRIGR